MSKLCVTSGRTALAVLLVAALPLVSQAGTINLIISDVDVSYSGSTSAGALFDVVAFPGGDLDPTESDEVATVVYELDGAPPPLSGGNNVVMSDVGKELYVDMKVDGIGASVPLNTLNVGVGANGGGFGLDYFGADGTLLRLGLDSVDMLLSPGVFFFTGTVSELFDQDLPFGLKFDPNRPIVISYTATLPAVPLGVDASMAAASGALTISGTQVPEPTSLTLLLLAGVTGLGMVNVRCRR